MFADFDHDGQSKIVCEDLARVWRTWRRLEASDDPADRATVRSGLVLFALGIAVTGVIPPASSWPCEFREPARMV